jgi:hypothetical protein
MSLVTKSGKTVRVEELPLEAQTQVATAWEMMSRTR